jgi:hypothetical protein
MHCSFLRISEFVSLPSIEDYDHDQRLRILKSFYSYIIRELQIWLAIFIQIYITFYTNQLLKLNACIVDMLASVVIDIIFS